MALAAGGEAGAKVVGGDSSDDAPSGGSSLAVEARGTKATSSNTRAKRGHLAGTEIEILHARAAAPEDLLHPRVQEELRSCGDAPAPTALAPASPPTVSAFTMPSASPRVGSEPPAPAGLAITPFGAASLAGKVRATVATGSGQPNTLPIQLFVPNEVESVGVKRAGEDLEEAEGYGEGALGAVARKKSKANAGDDGAPAIEKNPTTQVLLSAQVGRAPALALSRVIVRPRALNLLADLRPNPPATEPQG